jgi:hypothetical protein
VVAQVAKELKLVLLMATMTKVSGDRYVAKPAGNPAMSKIVVTADGKNFEFPMRIKRLPPPTGFVGAKKSGNINAAEFKAIGAIIAKLEDSDFEAPFKVVSYKLSAVGGPIQLYTEASNDGNRWNGQAASLVGRSGPGNYYFYRSVGSCWTRWKERRNFTNEVQPEIT